MTAAGRPHAPARRGLCWPRELTPQGPDSLQQSWAITWGLELPEASETSGFLYLLGPHTARPGPDPPAALLPACPRRLGPPGGLLALGACVPSRGLLGSLSNLLKRRRK